MFPSLSPSNYTSTSRGWWVKNCLRHQKAWFPSWAWCLSSFRKWSQKEFLPAVTWKCSPRKLWAVVTLILGLFALFWLAFICFHLFWLAFTCFHLFWLALTSYKWRQFVCACSVNVSLDTATKIVRMLNSFRSFKELLVIPAWVEFGEERTEHRSTLFGTDIDVIQLENFLIEFVLMEKSEGWIELL